MDNIMITVKDESDSFAYDMEIPATVPMDLVIEQLIGTLSLLNPSYPFYRKSFPYLQKAPIFYFAFRDSDITVNI